MNDDGMTYPTANQVPKELSLTVAASSMINAADRINLEAYQENLGRIRDVKEMVQRLEMNNESAHKNYLIDQLEKRTQEGREAEDMLARLKSQPGLSETVRITNNIPSENPTVVLPTTATLVEVPESYSSTSYPSSTPTTTFPPPTMQQSRPTSHQWHYPEPIHQYNTENFRFYRPPQLPAAPPPQAPVNTGQTGWYGTTRNVLPQSGVHNPPAHQTGFHPAQVRQPSQSLHSFPHQVVTPPAARSASGSGYNSSAARMRTTPAVGGLSSDSSNLTYHEQGIPVSSATSQTPFVTHVLLPQYPPILTSASQLQVPLQGAPTAPAMLPGRFPPTQPHPERAVFQSRPVSQTMSVPKLHQPHRPPQPPQRHRQQFQSEQHSQPPPQSPRAQPQFHILPRPPLQPEHHSQHLQVQLPLQRPPHSPPTQQVPPQSADRAPSSGISQLPTQPSQPTNVQEQASRRGSQPPVDQAMFNKYFQNAVERGGAYLKSFWSQAKVAGIRDEWFMAAIATVPRNVWETVLAQINQSGPTSNTMPVANAPQQQLSTAVGTNAPAAPEPSSTTMQAMPITQETGKSSSSAEAVTSHSGARQTSGPYAAQLQYYADQATRSILTQAADIPTQLPVNVTPTRTALATPQRGLPQVHAHVRTPKDANQLTLARDILRSLGKTVPELCQVMGGEPVEKANDQGSGQLPEVAPTQSVTSTAFPKPPAIPLAISTDVASSPSIPVANPSIGEELQGVASPGPSGARPGMKEERGVINGPIMIDLTLDGSDISENGKAQETASGGVADAPSRPASPTNTTNHTPLLENLTLKEPPVDVTADADNVDVHMSSPPLSLLAEENIESELVYPPPGGVASVSPSFEPIPREASARPSDGHFPLFLPSPPVSPVHTEPPETDLEMIDDGEGGPSRKRRSMDVDEIKADTGLVTLPRNRKRRKRQVYVLIPPAPLYVKKARTRGRALAVGMGSDLEGVGQDGEPQYNHLEQLLIEESKPRLLERRCRWLNCDAVLNCAANLLAHLKVHAREEDLQAPFSCRWASCRRQFDNEQERDVHLERHTIRPLPCPLAGCDKQFDKPVEVMQHEVQHQRADCRETLTLKPTYEPIVPAIPARLGPPPHQLPSHHVVPRRVVKCRISADRHATLGPWILWNIFSPVDLNMRKQNASMRGRSTRQAVNHDFDSTDRRDDYDFLLALSSYPAKHPPLDDLDSTLITASVARGLTLWGSKNSGGRATPEVHKDTPPPTAGDVTTEVPAAEEDAVERMLINIQ
ncbi:hypothetical protein JVU11DRAFT_1516 [Chiua virens]|nr:hypothetical protein JVU11DRAFT_1516 [Chiua virens]